MEIADFLRLLRKSAVLITALALLGAGVGAIVSLLLPPTYSAQTQVFVSTQGGDSSTDLAQGNSFTLSRVKTYARLATSQNVLDRVINELTLETTARDLAESVTAVPVLDTTIIAIEARAASPAEAADIADTIAASLAQTVSEVESATDAPSRIQLTTVERAAIPESPVSPRPLLNVILGGISGLVIAVAVAVVSNLLDTRVRTEKDVRSISNLPIVGSVPFDSQASKRPLIVHADPLNPRSESFRSLRTNLQFVDVDDESRAFVITSSVPGEGKSTTSANLALALADAGETTILVDADLRKPRVAEYMGLDGTIGLTDVLIGRVKLVDAVQMWSDSGLYVLPSGQVPPNPSELLGSRAMGALVAELLAEFDWVLFDAPPLLPVTDAALLAKRTAGAIMVVASGRTTRHQLEDALGILETAGAPAAGFAMTMLPVRPNEYRYAGYGQSHE